MINASPAGSGALPEPDDTTGRQELLVTGVVTGAVTRDRRTARSFGARALLHLTAAGAGLGATFAVLETGLSVVTWCFVGALAQLVALITILSLVTGGRQGRRGGGAPPRGAGEQGCEVRRFRLVDKTGRHVDCEVRGGTPGIETRPGDHLQVRGRRDRHGVLLVRRVLVTVTGAGATPRPGIGYLFVRAANVLALFLAAAVALLAFVLYAGTR